MSESFKTLVIGTSLNELSDGVVRTGVAVAKAAGASGRGSRPGRG